MITKDSNETKPLRKPVPPWIKAISVVAGFLILVNASSLLFDSDKPKTIIEKKVEIHWAGHDYNVNQLFAEYKVCADYARRYSASHAVVGVLTACQANYTKQIELLQVIKECGTDVK